MKIKTNVTIHIPGPKHKPFDIDAQGNRLSGNYDVVAVPPGTVIDLPEDEAVAILERHGGEQVAENIPVGVSAEVSAPTSEPTIIKGKK